MANLKKLEEEQARLAKKIILKDSFEKLELIAGASQSYSTDNNIVSAIAVCDYKTMELKEKVSATAKATFPYVAGFLSYREGRVISDAYSKLTLKPDVMLLSGNGILHPRKCGIASHIGILLDRPAIGVAHKLLLGEIKDNRIYVDGELRGEVIVTREHAKPVYVSPGHKISVRTSVEIVRNCLRFPHKMPEPLHMAHRYADSIKDETEKKELKAE